ncbi:MAG: hypothetical protein SXQ77_13860, partial [Halobacteria archaeon]|nr:hypothetical protein [Halobacteria archaeon]
LSYPKIMRKTVVLLVAVVVTLILLSGCIGGTESIDETYMSEYTYDVSVRTNATLENATFYLPAPVEDNESTLGQKLVAENMFDEANLSEGERQRATDQPDWNLSLVDTRHGRMLRIHADVIKPRFVTPQPIDEEGNPLPTNESPRPQTRSISVSLQVNNSIDTKNALENEPVLVPKYNITKVECDFPRPEDSAVECYRYDSRIYASYNVTNASMTSNPEIDLAVSFDGSNSWFTAGWTGNNYHDFTNTVIEGENDGWIKTNGRFTQGEGNYLDREVRQNVTSG